MSNHTNMENKRIDAEIAQLMANTAKLQAETMKLQKELKWFEVMGIVVITLAVVAVAKLFL